MSIGYIAGEYHLNAPTKSLGPRLPLRGLVYQPKKPQFYQCLIG